MKRSGFSISGVGGTGSVRAIALSALSLALLAGCGSQGDSTGSTQQGGGSGVTVALAVEDDPCGLLPRPILAERLSIPADEIEEMKIARTCQYDWKSDGNRMNVSVSVARVGEDAAKVREYFDLATRSMSAREVADAMEKVRAEAGSDASSAAADGVTGAVDGSGIMFEDAAGIGDKARFQLDSGRLHVLAGNLYFEVTGYHGPAMPMPAGVDLASLGNVVAQWEQQTMPERKETAEQLAQAVIANL